MLSTLFGLAVVLLPALPAPAQAPPDPESIVAPTPRPGGEDAPRAEPAPPPSAESVGDDGADGEPAAARAEAPDAAQAVTDASEPADPAAAGGDAPSAPTLPRHEERPVAFEVLNARAIPAPLGGVGGDPAAGPAAAGAAGCADCHVLPDGDGDTENGLVIAAARLGSGGLRLAIVNLGIRDPGRADHAFYDLPPFDPAAEAPPATLLTAAEVEAIVAWLTDAAR